MKTARELLEAQYKGAVDRPMLLGLSKHLKEMGFTPYRSSRMASIFEVP